MADTAPAQPATPGAPGASETPREGFMRSLAAERGEAPSLAEAQPQADEALQEETLEAADASEADDVDETDDQALSDDEEAQPETGDGTGITVDGEEWTPDLIRDLQARNHSLDAKSKQTWRDNARERAHHTREFESRMDLIEVQDKQYAQLATGNLNRYVNADVSQMSPEQFQQYHQQRAQAQQAAGQLQQWQEGERAKRTDAHSKLKDDEAAATAEYLKVIEPRWSNEFYGKIQAFAVEQLGYTPERFANITDVDGIEGLKARYDLHLLSTPGDVTRREPKKPSKRQKATQQARRRDARGQFQTLEKEVLNSTNARQDGSFRRAAAARLAAERGG